MIHLDHSSCADLARAGGHGVKSYGTPPAARCYSPAPTGRPISAATYWAAAIHESGHTLACLAAGWPLREVSIGPEPCGKGQTSIGRCRPAIDNLLRPDAGGKLRYPNDYRFRLRYCTYTLAGPSAEFVLLPDPPEKPCSDDMKYAKEDAETIFPGDAEYQKRFILVAGHDAARLVKRYCEEIKTVARALVERRRLTGRDVDRVLGISQ